MSRGEGVMSETKGDFVRVCLADHGSHLLRYARRLTGDPERAQDAVQETFLALWRADHEGLRPRILPWLLAVCRNKALDRNKKERPMVALQEGSAPSVEVSPQDGALAREREWRVRTALDALPERQQEVVVLKFQNGLSYREIAEVTGLSVSNVGFQLHVALKTLRERLAEDKTAGGAA